MLSCIFKSVAGFKYFHTWEYVIITGVGESFLKKNMGGGDGVDAG